MGVGVGVGVSASASVSVRMRMSVDPNLVYGVVRFAGGGQLLHPEVLIQQLSLFDATATPILFRSPSGVARVATQDQFLSTSRTPT